MKTISQITRLALIVTGIFSMQIAAAHITIDQPSASAGAYQKLTFKVGHGCDGSATNVIKISIPVSVSGTKPMPKAGWQLTTNIAPLTTPYTSHGKTISSDVREVTWTGGPLPDAYYDEFSIQVKLPDTPGKLYFKVSQQCEKGSLEWVEIPQEGQGKGSLKYPAPSMDIVPVNDHEHMHQH
ncbi:YcnI family protein [Undibacterium sp. RuRC25W]|uniref:YcnI family copper-binding membrane protein n=1 Tax=Undibacterium sp. RuRC25W TaxID=3413047 RepID=UPI003BF24226